jgi:hypothetical protein
MVKVLTFLKRKAGMSVEDFQRYWLTRHPDGAPRRSAYEAGRVPAHDGATSMWFDSSDALRAAAASPEYVAAVADRTGFLAPGQPPFIVTQEHVIVA